MRIRGEVLITKDITDPASNQAAGAMGIGLQSVRSTSTQAERSITMPAPIAEGNWGGWMWYHAYNLNDLNSGAGFVDSNAVTSRQQVDSKGMRRVSDAMELVLVIQNDVGSRVSVQTGFRILIKE